MLAEINKQIAEVEDEIIESRLCEVDDLELDKDFYRALEQIEAHRIKRSRPLFEKREDLIKKRALLTPLTEKQRARHGVTDPSATPQTLINQLPKPPAVDVGWSETMGLFTIAPLKCRKSLYTLPQAVATLTALCQVLTPRVYNTEEILNAAGQNFKQLSKSSGQFNRLGIPVVVYSDSITIGQASYTHEEGKKILTLLAQLEV